MALTLAVLLPLIVLALLAAGYRIVSGLPSVAYERAIRRLQGTVDELESAYQMRWSTLQAHRELAGWQRVAAGGSAPLPRGPGGMPLAATCTDGESEPGSLRPPS
ncbi:MAG: hypothetical protein ACJ786_29095 [Catenulispora sp.]